MAAMTDWFALADELDLRLVAAGSTTATPIDGGIVLRNEQLPAIRYLNIVVLRAPLRPTVTADALIALADRGLHGVPGRAVRISDEASAEHVAPGLHAAGWERRRTVLMVRPAAGGPALPGPDPRAREVGESEHTALMRAIFAETDYGPEAPAELPELLVAAQHAQQAGLACRRFAAGEGGDLQSMCELFTDDDVDGVAMAVVEQVATLASHRMRGLAKAVTVAAMSAAIAGGAKLIMVPADREDWPQMIYAGLGCETVGTVTSFFRAAPSAGVRA
jgi:hypothetical protein